MYLEVLLVLFTYFFLLFVLGQIVKDNSIVDIGWGFGYVIAAVYTFFRSGHYGLRTTLITLMITVWGLRLTYYLAKRNLGKPEDYRYVKMRKRWGDSFALVKAFFNVYFLQFAVMAVVSLPIVNASINPDQSIHWFNYLGIFLWALGFFFEVVGDYQLRKFKENPKNKGEIMDQGVWSLTRHPNYFGDASMWFGIFFIAVTNLGNVWTIISPIVMTVFLYFVSGVRMLEKRYEGNEKYDEYKKHVSKFIPRLPKK